MSEFIEKIYKYIDYQIRNWLVHIYKYHMNNNDGFLSPNYISKKEMMITKNKWNKVVEKIYKKSLELERDDYRFVKGKIELEGYDIATNVSGDNYGKVLIKNNTIYRAIRNNRAYDFAKLWKSGILQALSFYGYLPNMKITEFSIEDYPVIVEVETVNIYPSEIWTMSLIKEAAICMCIIREVAQKRGYVLIDGHTNNLGFKNGRLLLFDIGSIDDFSVIKKYGARDINCRKEIAMTCCYRIVFSMLGNMALSRWQVYDEYNNGIRVKPFHREDSNREFRYALKLFKSYHFRSGIRYRWLLHKVFDELDVRSYYVDLLFRVSEDVTDIPTYYNLDYLRWIDVLKYNKISELAAAELGGSGGRLCEQLVANDMVREGFVFEYNERFAEYTSNWIKKEGINGIQVFLLNYLYGIRHNILVSIKPDIAIVVDIINNNYYFPLFCDLDLMIYKLSLISKKYVLCSFKESYISSRYEKQFVDCSLFERKISKRFKIIAKERDNNPGYNIYLLELC